jgi:hypothetical protein
LYVLALPTSDVRTHVYILIGLSGWSFALAAFVSFLVIGLCASWLAGWRNRWSVGGAVVGSLVPLALIYSGILGCAVWMHEEDVTPFGRAIRIATIIAGLAFAWRALRAGTAEEATA